MSAARKRLGAALLACICSGAGHGMELTIDRLFEAPSLSGPALAALKISPDGSRVFYLQGKPDAKDRLDLWEYDVQTRRARILVDSNRFALGGALSTEEADRRERQRTAALSGILDFSIAPSGRSLLFEAAGGLYQFSLDAPEPKALRRLLDPAASATDAQVSPRGRYVAYVRNQNLFVYDLDAGREIALTHDGAGLIKNGMAEFVAQEEMDRSTGYWWSADDGHIAFARIDESPIPQRQRFEIQAGGLSVITQRYPAAGESNANVRLGVVEVKSGAIRWLELGSDHDFYLARVNWLPDAATLAIQIESRDQRRLDLLFADAATGSIRRVLTETSRSWIELNDELTFLKKSPQFIWASSRDGFRHLYLYDLHGDLIRQITQGDWNVEDFRARAIKAVDESRRLVYFTATEKHPTERHLYAASLDTRTPRLVKRITEREGVHSIVMSADARLFADQFTSPSQPQQAGVWTADGNLIGYLSENLLDERHPYAPFAAEDSAPQFGELSAADGTALEYRLLKPRNFQPGVRYPAIIEVYGGPGVQRVLKAWSGATFSQILTRAGYVVFQLDNRGSASRGEKFQAAIKGRLGVVEVEDQIRGAEWLAQQPFIDSARIGVWGWSYGGYMTLMLMFKAPDVFKAGVAGAPVTDWTLYDTHYTERYLGRPQEDPEGYRLSGVLPFANALSGRLLVMHGMADDNVLFQHSTELFRKLQDLGKPFDIMTYPGGKHALVRTRDGRHAYKTIARFFDDSLKPARP